MKLWTELNWLRMGFRGGSSPSDAFTKGSFLIELRRPLTTELVIYGAVQRVHHQRGKSESLDLIRMYWLLGLTVLSGRLLGAGSS
jgi:hypothetical protein